MSAALVGYGIGSVVLSILSDEFLYKRSPIQRSRTARRTAKKMYRKYFRGLPALNLGALAGIGVAALLYKCYPALFHDLSDRTHFILYGGVIGGAVTQAIRSGISPLFKLVVEYGRIFEAHVFLRARVIDDHKFSEVMNHLVDCHFGLTDKTKRTKD